jgi:hypothetical protein
LSEERRSFRDAAKPPQIPRTSETLTTRKKTFENDIATRRARFASVGSIATTPWSSTVYLPEPFLIWVSPAKSSSFVTNTMTAPFDSRVKFLVPSTEYDGSIFISFYFTWFNESIFQATITNLSSQLVLNGNAYGYVSAPPFFFGLFEGERDLSFGTFADWTISQGSKLEGGEFLNGKDFEISARFFDDQAQLSFEYQPMQLSSASQFILVPPQTGVVIEVVAIGSWSYENNTGTDDGEGEAGNTFFADFASNELDYFVQSSGVMFDVQTPVIIER